MKILLKSKLLYLLLFFFSISSTLKAQWDCDTEDCDGGGGTPPTPGQGLGNQATPIDEYTIYLIGFAIAVAVVYFAMNKYKKSLI